MSSDEDMVFGFVYSSPKAKLLSCLEPIFKNLAGTYNKILVSGDFNVDLLVASKPSRDSLIFFKILDF
jgi:hypothetical protein